MPRFESHQTFAPRFARHQMSPSRRKAGPPVGDRRHWDQPPKSNILLRPAAKHWGDAFAGSASCAWGAGLGVKVFGRAFAVLRSV